MSKILARVKELLISAQQLDVENIQLVEITNKQLERIEQARQSMLNTSTKRQKELLDGLTSRKGAIYELLKLELGDDAKPDAIEAKSMELQKELQAEAEAKQKAAAAAKASKQEAKVMDAKAPSKKQKPAPLEMVKPSEEKADLKN